MDKNTLKQYKALEKEIPRLKTDICKLEERLAAVPIVKTKVNASMSDFPYIEGYKTVDASEPKLATELKKQIRLKELQLEKAERDRTKILEFISSLSDSEDREIFELVYQKGKKLEEVGNILGYTKGRISQKITKCLKD